jgi:hypothetical protein
VECPRIGPKTHQSCRLAPDWKAYRPVLMRTSTFPMIRFKIISHNGGDRCTLDGAGKPKWKSQFTQKSEV